jgi:hypothetical protein
MLSKMFIEYEDGLQVEKVVHNSETSFKTKNIMTPWKKLTPH